MPTERIGYTGEGTRFVPQDKRPKRFTWKSECGHAGEAKTDTNSSGFPDTSLAGLTQAAMAAHDVKFPGCVAIRDEEAGVTDLVVLPTCTKCYGSGTLSKRPCKECDGTGQQSPL